MHINDLPSELLISILRQVYWYNPHRLKQWINAIPTMAVCRKWRAIALHYAHRRLIIEPKSQYDYFEISASNFTPKYQGSMKWVESTVNILPSELKIQPKHLILNIDYKVGYVKVIRFAVLLLQKYSTYISNVTNLVVCNIGGIYSNNRAQYHFGDSVGEVRLLTNTLVQLCPKVSTLMLRGMNSHVILSTFAQGLFLRYVPQLSIISTTSDCIVLAPNSFKTITSLEIAKSSPSWGVLPVDSNSLKRLTISNYSDGFCWDSFENKNSNGAINFESLHNLTINVQFDCRSSEEPNSQVIWLGPKEKIQHMIIAPNLKAVDVELCPFTCSLLAAIVCSCQLEKLTIRMPCGICLQFYDFTLAESAKNLFIAYSGNTSGIINYIGFLNDILNRQRLANVVMMESHYIPHSLLGKHAIWCVVSSLTIYNRIELADLLQIIGKMQNLTSIRARWIFIDSNGTDEERACLLHQPFSLFSSPLSTSIKHIVLRFMPTAIPSSHYELLDSSMYRYIPSLVSLTFDENR